MASKRLATVQKRQKPKPPQKGSLGGSQKLPANARMALAPLYAERLEHVQETLAAYREKLALSTTTVDRLRGEQAQWVELFENTPAGYLVHDSAGYIQKMNRAAALLLGLAPEPPRPSGLCLLKFLTEASLLRWLGHIKRCAATPESRVVELQLRVGPRPYRDLQAVTWASRGSLRRLAARSFYTLIFPNSQKGCVEHGLAKALRDYHELVDRIEGIVWEADPDYTVTFVSRYAERLLGFPLSIWTQPGFWVNRIYVQDRERVLGELHRALSAGNEARLDYRVTASDRRLVWLHDSITLVERDGQRKLLGVAIDITEQRRAAEELHRAHFLLEQRVEERTADLRRVVGELEAFSYSLSHDMRAPIRAMQGYVVLVRDLLGSSVSPQAADYLNRIQHGAERLDLLVQDVLKYTRLGRCPLELKPVALEPLVAGLIDDYTALRSLKAQIEIVTPLPLVYGHEAFVSQAISNLLSNAVKFVPKGKQPRVRIWADTMDQSPKGHPQWVRIWVEDNGLGIAPEDQSRIFRIFERVYSSEQYEGTGMGLAIVQKAVQQLGGRVGVESNPGQGSRFWIALQLATPAPPR